MLSSSSIFLHQTVVNNHLTVMNHCLHYNPLELSPAPIPQLSSQLRFYSYSPESCPGVGTCTPEEQFPIIQTLLSIPFSVLHTVPRLAAFTRCSSYQRRVLEMGQHIMDLWSWDPPSSSNPISVAQRSPLPLPIFHSSRPTPDYNFSLSIHSLHSLHSL